MFWKATTCLLLVLVFTCVATADPPRPTRAMSAADMDAMIANRRARFRTGNLMPRLLEWEREYPVFAYRQMRVNRIGTVRGTVMSRAPLYIALGGQEDQPVFVLCDDQEDQRDRCARVRVGQQVAIAAVVFSTDRDPRSLYPRAPSVMSVRLFSIHSQGWVEW